MIAQCCGLRPVAYYVSTGLRSFIAKTYFSDMATGLSCLKTKQALN